MKLLVIAASMILFATCTQTEKSTEEKFPGVYTRSVEDPTGSLADTLCITWISDPPSHIFKVIRNTAVVNMDDHGNLLAPEHKQQKWTAEFQYDKKTVEIFETGEHYFLLPDNKGITNGYINYKRLK